MNGIFPHSSGKKRGPKPKNENGINGIFPSSNRYVAAPPKIPSPGPLNFSPPRVISPPRLSSPKDPTDIVIEGEPVDLESMIEHRITNSDTIEPMSPPRNTIPIMSPPREYNLTPNNFIQSDIKVIKTPQFEKEATPQIMDETMTPSTGSETSAFKIDDSSPQSEGFRMEEKEKKKPRNIMSLLPTYTKGKNISPVTEVFESDDEEEEETVQVPIPVFKAVPRVVSPVHTIDPKSPGVVKAISPPVRSVSPQKAFNLPIPQAPAIPDSLKFPSPKPLHPMGAPEPVKMHQPESPSEISPRPYEKNPPPQSYVREVSPPREEPMFIPPQYNDNVRGVTQRPDYSKLTKEQEIYLKSVFKVKFGILREQFPQYSVIEPHESLTAEQIHDLYDYYMRQIMVSRETGQYKMYMVIVLMFIEVIGVKVLKLNMSGYTMSQMKIMSRYDALFMELGEKWLVNSGSNWPIEARICMMILFNAVIFLVIRYLCKWIGAESMAEPLQNIIDNMLNGPGPRGPEMGGGFANPPARSFEPGANSAPPSEGGNPFDKIADMFGNFMGNNSNKIAEKVAQFGTAFTKNMQNSNAQAQETKPSTVKPAAKPKINKKKLFSDSD